MKKSPTVNSLTSLLYVSVVIKFVRYDIMRRQRRLPAHHLVALPAVASARDKGRNGREQRGGGDEPLEIDQQRQQGDERQDLADQAEGRLHHRTGRNVASRCTCWIRS